MRKPASWAMRSVLACVAAVAAGLVASGQVPTGPARSGPAKVEIRQVDGRYRLTVNGRPFHIRGAGIEVRQVDSLALFHGNALRTWRPDTGPLKAEQLLDAAHARGVMVAMGLSVGPGRRSADYDDPKGIAEQKARIRAEVLRLKDHPALLMWVIGNELNLGRREPRVWDVVNDLSRMIHEIDPNHPTITPLAGINLQLADDLRARAPDLDAIGIQLYGDVISLPRYLRESKWTGPYVLTEWGTTGHWEVFRTPWGAPLEYDSSAKANAVQQRHDTVVSGDEVQSLGSFVFLWGQKQERTPTWYSMFLPSGESTEVVDVMTRIWTGSWPANRSPLVSPPTLDGRLARQGVRLAPGGSYVAQIAATDPDGDPLRVQWVLMEESKANTSGGAPEDVPPVIDGSFPAGAEGPRVTVKAPDTPGAYRLFVYVYDGKGHGAHANVPFLVEPAEASPPAAAASRPR